MAGSGRSTEAIRLTSDAISRHALDPEAHAIIAHLFLAGGQDYVVMGIVEALAARVLDPRNPQAWKRWGMLQYRGRIYEQAGVSLTRYFALGGSTVKGDKEARRILESIPSVVPGGKRYQEAMRSYPVQIVW